MSRCLALLAECGASPPLTSDGCTSHRTHTRSSRRSDLTGVRWRCQKPEGDGQVNQVKRRAVIFAVYVLVALLAAACGGGSHHHGGASGGSGQLTARSVDIYAACIRGHGVPNFYFTRKTPNSQVTSGIELGPWVASADPS